MSQSPDEMGKLFIGGLSWETTQDSLCNYFSKYGEVVDCVVMKNPESGRSRGFGFVTFKDPNCAEIVLTTGPHILDERAIDPKLCNPRNAIPRQSSVRGVKTSLPKVFLGGLPANVTEAELRNYFSKFGKVLQVVIMYDEEKKRNRGFGFLSFETDDIVDSVCAERFVTIGGKQVEVKKAEPNARRGMGMGGGVGYGRGRHSEGWGDIGGQSAAHMGMGSNGMYSGWGGSQQGYGAGYQNWGGQQATSYAGYGAYGAYSPYNYGWSMVPQGAEGNGVEGYGSASAAKQSDYSAYASYGTENGQPLDDSAVGGSYSTRTGTHDFHPYRR